MPTFHPILRKSYWFLAGLGGLWAVFILCLTNATFQRHVLYARKVQSGNFWHDVSNPEAFGFAKGQVQPFYLNTTDRETLFCWHVLPLDVYLENEDEIVRKAGGVSENLKETVGYKLLMRDPDGRVVVNFHGNAGHVAQGYRPSTYRSISGIPHTHLLTCDYRGFGHSTLRNNPHIPTESGVITDGVSLVSYILHTLQHPADRTVLLGQSLGTAVTAATALYFTDPSTRHLPHSITHPSPIPKTAESFAGIILVASFPDIPVLLKSYKISGIIPILSPLNGYPKIAAYLSTKVVDHWPTLLRLQYLLSASKTAKSSPAVHITVLHARNDQDIDFRLGEAVYLGLEQIVLGEANAEPVHERRTIQGQENVRRGAFAYRRVEDGEGRRVVELEVVRYGGHNQVVSFPQVNLAVRRAWEGNRRVGKVGLDVE
ncbi:uncharacterized protein EI97DRAFT_434818 [Westerdykella ornata]|uniref:Alpha/beta-hydrolase n=1 Tax=Westerdykella ornata TaxID=318751 RepID=A0A6A6JF74_WESOR|nr:uncharacterized protein EI97DRAFT_434818 [Westerdykella ornata]KAF2274915.1 hypothetical protein EI97DRAFT_434818 [Westerdykella ornata]